MEPAIPRRIGHDTYSVSHDTRNGIRIRMVRRITAKRIPTVRQIIDTLAKKHEHLLLEEIRQRSRNIETDSKNSNSTATLNEPLTSNLKHCISSTSINDLDLDSRPAAARCKQHREHFRKSRMKLSNSVDKLSWDARLSSTDPGPVGTPAMHIVSVPQINALHQGRINPLKMNGIRTSLVNKTENLTRSTDNKVRKSNDDNIATGAQSLSDPTLDKSLDCPTLSSRRLTNTSTVNKPVHLGCIRQSLPSTEPKYSDPLSGGSSSYHQRVSEIASLELETVRWERGRRARRKARQDRDS